MIESQRKDRRGHWPRGRRRHADVRPPRGWPDLEAFLSCLQQFCVGRRLTRELARNLGLHRKSVQTWLAARKLPAQSRVDEMAAWWRSEHRDEYREWKDWANS